MSSQHYLSQAEKRMVVSTHAYLQQLDEGNPDARAGGLRKRVAKCLKISERTVDRVMSRYHADNDVIPDTVVALPRGRPSLSYSDDLITSVRMIVNQKNLRSEPTSVKDIEASLEDQFGQGCISERTLNRLLHRSGFFFGKGKKRNVLVESDGVIALRANYLRLKIANRDANGLPILPEIFLDESYCNKNHTRAATWIDSSTNVQYVASGKGPRAVIIGAGAIFAQSNKLCGEFVPNSLDIWNSLSRSPDDDYHGNFNATIFEDWFQLMCYSVMMTYGPAVIHMDGARYHLRVLHPIPTTSWLKPAIQEWLSVHGIQWEASMLKDELLSLVKSLHVQKQYVCVKIAANFGHRVLITPPYHPELQSIEIIWGVVKNAIASSPPRSMAAMVDQLWDHFDNLISSKTWTGAYKKVQGFENQYWAGHLVNDTATAGEDSCSDSEEEGAVTYTF